MAFASTVSVRCLISDSEIGASDLTIGIYPREGLSKVLPSLQWWPQKQPMVLSNVEGWSKIKEALTNQIEAGK